MAALLRALPLRALGDLRESKALRAQAANRVLDALRAQKAMGPLEALRAMEAMRAFETLRPPVVSEAWLWSLLPSSSPSRCLSCIKRDEGQHQQVKQAVLSPNSVSLEITLKSHLFQDVSSNPALCSNSLPHWTPAILSHRFITEYQLAISSLRGSGTTQK